MYCHDGGKILLEKCRNLVGKKVNRVPCTSHTGSWMGTSCGPVMESGVGLRGTAFIIEGGS